MLNVVNCTYGEFAENLNILSCSGFNEYNLSGVSYWTIEFPFAQNLLVLNSMYNIKK